MDYRDVLLRQAHAALRSTRDVLQKILDDNDDIVLSATEIGDIEEVNTMENTNMDQQQPEATPIERLRTWTFHRVSELGYRVTPQQAEKLYQDLCLWWGRPAHRWQKIFDHVRDPRHPYPELPANPWSTTNTVMAHSTDAQLRMDAVLECICLYESLHRQDPESDLMLRAQAQRRRYESRVLYKDETPIEKMRRLAFDLVAQWTGKPVKRVAKVYDAIDWKDPVRWDEKSQTGRFAVVYEFVYADLPQSEFYRSEPKDEAEYKRRLANSKRVWEANERAKAQVWHVIKAFENLRSETATWNRAQGEKAARQARLQEQIERAQAQLARNQAA